jgi:hypothetical protein
MQSQTRRFTGSSSRFEERSRSPENRGVPGSNPAVQRRNPARSLCRRRDGAIWLGGSTKASSQRGCCEERVGRAWRCRRMSASCRYNSQNAPRCCPASSGSRANHRSSVARTAFHSGPPRSSSTRYVASCTPSDLYGREPRTAIAAGLSPVADSLPSMLADVPARAAVGSGRSDGGYHDLPSRPSRVSGRGRRPSRPSSPPRTGPGTGSRGCRGDDGPLSGSRSS